jgi:DNA-binding response OmpR family regulator
MSKKILLVEDDHAIGSLVEAVFSGNGSQITWCTTGKDAKEALQNNSFDICILDLSLPDMDGLRLSAIIKSEAPQTPFLFITANQDNSTKYQAFEAGCDDFVIKPFQIRELVLRVDAILRRVSNKIPQVHIFPAFTFDFNSRIITTSDKNIKLSTKEAFLFKLLFDSFNKTVTRKFLMQEVWGTSDLYTSKSLDVYLSKLRKIISNDTAFEILNEHGVGYKLINK